MHKLNATHGIGNRPCAGVDPAPPDVNRKSLRVSGETQAKTHFLSFCRKYKVTVLGAKGTSETAPRASPVSLVGAGRDPTWRQMPGQM